MGKYHLISLYACVAFAGITSTVSIVEPAAAYLKDRMNWTQAKATWVCCALISVVGIFVILSITADYGAIFSIGGMSLFDIFDNATSKILMPLGGFFILIFASYVIGKKRLREYTKDYLSPILFEIWYIIIAFIAPLVIAVIGLAPFFK